MVNDKLKKAELETLVSMFIMIFGVIIIALCYFTDYLFRTYFNFELIGFVFVLEVYLFIGFFAILIYKPFRRVKNCTKKD